MSLSSKLRLVDLLLECKYCRQPISKKGVWFMTAHQFKCENCKRAVPITYSDKVALFAKHGHLA